MGDTGVAVGAGIESRVASGLLIPRQPDAAGFREAKGTRLGASRKWARDKGIDLQGPAINREEPKTTAEREKVREPRATIQ